MVLLYLIRNNQVQIKGSSFYCDYVGCESGQLCEEQCLQLKQVLKLLLLVGASVRRRQHYSDCNAR